MKVECDLRKLDLPGDGHMTIKGEPYEGVQAVCGRCGHQTESFGTSVRSVNRCLALMREQCPNREENYYSVVKEPAS